MLLRIRREIFRAGEFETYEIAGVSFREDICREYHLDAANTEFYDDTGNLIKEDVFRDYVQVTAVQKPASLTTAAVVAAAVAFIAAGAVIGYSLYWQKHGNQAKIVYSNSLRGAQNPMRAGGPVGILLGNYRVPLDMAGMVYSSVNDNKQYVHELFCAGYRPTASNAYCGVLLRTDASQAGGVPVYGGDGNPHNYKAWIGDTPFGSVAKSISISASDDKSSPDILGFPYYNKRCIEDSLSLKLLNADTNNGGSAENILQYQAPSGCYRIAVCICAPYGYYMLDEHGNQATTLMSYLIQCRKVGASDWYNIDRVHWSIATNVYRVVHSKTLTDFSDFSINDRYEVRIMMDDGNAWHTESKYNTALLVDFIQYDTVNITKYLEGSPDAKTPVYNSQQYALVDMKAQATDKLTGYINQFYVECYLQCRAYHGDGSETSDYQSNWYLPSTNLPIATRIEMMSNPASVLLYVLTNKNVNPRALTWEEAADKIDWIAFRDWYLFCANKHWTCNAWITDQMMIGKLCDLICSTGRAMFRTLNGKYSVLLACANPVITQMFTPRNAWDMQLNKSFEKPLDAVKVDFVDESTWTEAERTAYVDENNTVVIDEDITDIEDQLTVESFAIWGVTRPKQIADLEAYQLLQRRLQVRTYAWKCSLEGLMCAVGDVVYMANDNFLYSLGYGRIKSLKTSGNNVVGVYVDESLGMESGHTYGITVRQNNGTFATYRIASITADENTFDKGLLCTLANPIPSSSAAVEEGNLFMYGDANAAGKKLLITNIQYDTDRNASVEAVDYIPEIFQSLDSDSWVVPDYVSGISKYGSGASFAKGAVSPVLNNPPSSVHMTDVNISEQIQGLQYEIEYALSESSVTPPSGEPSVYGYSANDSYGANDPSDSEDFEYGFLDIFNWGDDYDDWYKGLYVWQRFKVTDINGNITYTDPIYCKEITESLEQSCFLEVIPNPRTYVHNPRLASYQYIPVVFRSVGMRGVLTVSVDYGVFSILNPQTGQYEDVGTSAQIAVDGGTVVISTYNVKIPYASRDTVVVTASLLQWTSEVTAAFSSIAYMQADTITVQLSTVPAYEDLPDSLNLTDSSKTDIVTGNNLISGDYILVCYVTLTPTSTSDAVDETGASYSFASFDDYYTRSGGTFTLASISAFVIGTTYYAFRMYPWKYNGSAWERTMDSSIKVDTLDEIVRLAKEQKEAYPTANVDYHDCLYAYEAFIQNLTVGILNVGDVFANNIQSNGYQEDNDGTPVSGYKLEYRGGASQQGLIKSVGGLFSDMNVRGALRLWKDDTETVGADIEHPALTTISEAMAGDPTGVTVNTQAVAWSGSSLLNAVNGVSRNAVLTASGSFGDKTLQYCTYATNLNTILQAAYSESGGPATSYTYGYRKVTSTTITIPSYVRGNISFTVSGETSYAHQKYSGYLVSRVYVQKNSDTIVLRNRKLQDYRFSDISFAYSTTLTGGDTIYVQIDELSYYSTSDPIERYTAGHFTIYLSQILLSDFVSSTGFWLDYTDRSQVLISSNDVYTSILSMSAPVSFNSNNYLTLRNCSAFVNYRTFTDSGGNTRTLTNGRTYDITSANLQVNGSSATGVMFTRLTNSVVLYYKLNSSTVYSIELVSSGYYNVLGTIKVAETNTIGVKMMGNYPKRDADDPQGGFDCGNSAYAWRNGYFKTIHYQNVGGGSARILKENIVPFTKSALDIIMATEIVNYNYKKDVDKRQKIGFIADDTPAELAGQGHDRMELDHCVAVLIKAVQELEQEIDALREEKET